jgi:phospholipid/cholesterol/gamma-HCH transport system substrate-binding protein
MTTTAKIGAFFLAVLLALGVLILKIEDIPIGRKTRAHVFEVKFKDVAGLDDKSAVRIAGVRVGKVDGIRLLPDGTAVAKVALEKDVELREGAFGQIRNLGLLGDKYIELSPGRVGAPRLPEGAQISGSVPTGFDDLSKLASDIGKDVKELTAALSASLGGDKGEERINRIVDNIGALAESLRELVESNRDNLDITMANLKEFSASIRETLARVDRILDDNRESVKGSLKNIDELTAKLKTAADNLGSITGKVDAGEGTVGKLINDEETVKNVNEALQSVKSGVDQLSTTLGRMNRLQLDLGFRGEYLTRPGGGKAYFTLDVIPSERKFYRVEIAALTNGLRRDTTDTTTVTFPDGSSQTIQTVSNTLVDQFGFTLQAAYRLNNTIFRAGLIESRGGLAVDQYFLKDRLSFTGEVWDFGRPSQNIHGKLTGRWNLNANLFGSVGVDDLFQASQRSLFIGAGIRWKDEDIKPLLTSIPIPK